MYNAWAGRAVFPFTGVCWRRVRGTGISLQPLVLFLLYLSWEVHLLHGVKQVQCLFGTCQRGSVLAVHCEGSGFIPGHSSLKLQESLKANCPLDLGLQTVDIGSLAKPRRALPACFCVVTRCAVTPFSYARTQHTLCSTGSSGTTVSLERSDWKGFGGGELCVGGTDWYRARLSLSPSAHHQITSWTC